MCKAYESLGQLDAPGCREADSLDFAHVEDQGADWSEEPRRCPALEALQGPRHQPPRARGCPQLYGRSPRTQEKIVSAERRYL